MRTGRSRAADGERGWQASAFVLVTALAGVVVVVLSAYYGAEAHRRIAIAARSTGEAIGAGLVAAAVVGMLVDQVTRRKLARETGESWLWVVLGQDTPDSIRDTFKRLVDQVHVTTLTAQVSCEMTWDDAADRTRVRLAVTSVVSQVNHSRRHAHLPEAQTWAMPSLRNSATRFTGWAYEVFDEHNEAPPRSLRVPPDIIDTHTSQAPVSADEAYQPSGTISLDQGAMLAEATKAAGVDLASLRARPGALFKVTRSFELVLGESGFFPYIVTHPTADVGFTFSGEALSDLELYGRSTTGSVVPVDTAFGKRFEPGALLPGQGVFFSWTKRPAVIKGTGPHAAAAVTNRGGG